jgi:hypothetical protein
MGLSIGDQSLRFPRGFPGFLTVKLKRCAAHLGALNLDVRHSYICWHVRRSISLFRQEIFHRSFRSLSMKQFMRLQVRENSPLMLSMCSYCHHLAGAGSSDDQLAIIERMHSCVFSSTASARRDDPGPPQR